MDDDSLCCPITGERFVDPVMDQEGNTYERSAIMEWLAKHKTSPITRSPLDPSSLVPNRALANLLQSSTPGHALISAPAEAPDELDLGQLTFTEKPENPNLPFETAVKAVHGADGTVSVSVDLTSEHVGHEHNGSTIICVIDISYSMDNNATMHGDEEGSSGLSLLDIVKHATHTIIETLEPHDMLGVVAYANEAKIVLPIRAMIQENKTIAWERVEALETSGQTNLWDGLRVAMEMATGSVTDNCSILLLTDGLPNIEPPRGHLQTLKKYLDDNPSLRCEISTFGFGYKLDTNLLLGIAMLGRGSYSFIPDSSFVGTCFVNATANILATAVPFPTLEIVPINGAKTLGTLCSLRCTGGEEGLVFELPNLQHGQRKDILLRIAPGPDKSLPAIKAVLSTTGNERRVLSQCESSLMVPDSQDAKDLHVNHVRLLMVNLITDHHKKLRALIKSDSTDAQKALEAAQADINSLLARVDSRKDSSPTEAATFSRFKEDLQGQVTQAFTRLDWYKRWGVHYLPSLARAHTMQLCTNFKDAGLQGYSGKKFCAIRDLAEDVFIKLPPPTPSLDTSGAAPVSSMAVFHNANNPCFASGPVRMASGALKDVSRVRAGDAVVSGGSGATAVVKCVVATSCAGGACELVELPGTASRVLVTPYHPVRTGGGDWCFPGTLRAPESHTCDFVYSFVLEGPSAGSMVIGDYEAVTLGHGLSGPVVGHPFLGTTAVLSNLSALDGWEGGLIRLPPGAAVRDPASGLIVGLRQGEAGAGCGPPGPCRQQKHEAMADRCHARLLPVP